MHLINKRLLAIDYGTKFVGLAHKHHGHDPFVLLYGRLKYESDEKLTKEIQTIIEDEFIDIIVIGMPFLADGSDSEMTIRVKNFKNLLADKISIPIYEQDETLSSYEAEEKMKNDPRFNFKVDLTQIDSVAASIILEDFLSRASEMLK